MECLVNHPPCSSQPSHTRQRVVPPPPAARGRRRASCPRAVSRQRVPASAFERLPAGASPAMMRSGRGRARRRPLRERLRACDPARACCIPRGSPVAEEAPAMNAVGSFPRPAGGSVCTKRVRAGGPALPAPDLPPRGHGRLRAVGRPAFPGYPAYEPSTRRCPLACPTGAGPAARPFPPSSLCAVGAPAVLVRHFARGSPRESQRGLGEQRAAFDRARGVAISPAAARRPCPIPPARQGIRGPLGMRGPGAVS
jgi:hypothetical protein